jgi:hypothetical protein
MTSKKVNSRATTHRGGAQSEPIPIIPPTSQMLQRERPTRETAEEESVRTTRNVFGAAIFGVITFIHTYVLFKK